MILHIGNGKTVRGEEIVGIFDLDNATLEKESRAFLSAATKAGEVSYADSDIPRAFLVMAKKKQKISPQSPKEDVKKGSALLPTAEKTAVRPRHPSRKRKAKKEKSAQTVLLSHISSGALHARCERPFEED